ncbi:fatty acyl-CoA elongase, putative [Ixodes scapularis]|uniref:Elongation of very long chain fatty acids protein n=1 Tax=Ixodes scapularis TaxID=6945 RepID=B7PBY1_IXOSC|nr:fatty acyl-CoA elongase, putative [Ixodes scapularis]|eukprot:XP_002409060.1 fatty acyl-CoA elongase, putative [Ixodes scapularis]
MANTVAAALPAHSLASMLFSGGDPRVRHWALMGSPAVIVSILAGYLYFSLRLGPALMKNRRPFHIRPLVVTYNVVMVTLSVYFFALTLKLTYLRGSGAYSLFCQGTDGDSTAMPLLYHGWFYMLMKVGELLDTVFFVLLKKNGHISFLHLLHHSVALSTVWLDINNGITGQVAMFPILNTAVHMCLSLRTGSCTSPSVAVIDKPHRSTLAGGSQGRCRRQQRQQSLVLFASSALRGGLLGQGRRLAPFCPTGPHGQPGAPPECPPSDVARDPLDRHAIVPGRRENVAKFIASV